MTIISIIIPVYNTEKFLVSCLESLLSQDVKNIEIILVNDASTDQSQEIIDTYTQKYNHIRSLVHTTNKGLLEARRTGILNAKGQYCLALDSDDQLAEGSLEALVKLIQVKNPDIIQYNLIDSQKSVVTYIEHALYGDEIFKTLLVNNQFPSWVSGAKCISTEILRKVFEEIPPAHIIHSEDFIINYHLFYFAKHYEFCKDASYIYIRHENNSSSINLNDENIYSKWETNFSCIYKTLAQFKQKYQISAQYPIIKGEILHDYYIVDFFFVKLQVSNQRRKIVSFCKALGAERLFYILEKYYSQGNLIRLLPPEKQHKTPRPINTIGVILRNFDIGGIERISQILISQFLEQGKKIVVFLDDLKDAPDQLPQNMTIELVPEGNFFEFISQKIEEHHIDVVHVQNHGDFRNLLFLWYAQYRDVLTICSVHGGALWMLVVTHPLTYHPYYFCADVVTVLSQSDKQYLQQFTSTPIVYIPNLLTFDPKSTQNSILEEDNVLFIGRLAFQKRSAMLIQTFSEVLKELPYTKLTIVGDGVDKEPCLKLINKLKLSKNVFMEGAKTDVTPYLQKASLLVVPSLYEGFPMVITEAMAHGIPVLVSHLSYMELIHCDGVITFDRNSADDFLKTMVQLLKDKNKIQELGQKAKESVKQFDNSITMQKWAALLNELETLHFSPELLSIERELSLDEINNIYYQEYYQYIFMNSRSYLNPSITYPKQIRIVRQNLSKKEKFLNLCKMIIPRNSIVYRAIRKSLVILNKIISKINQILEISY